MRFFLLAAAATLVLGASRRVPRPPADQADPRRVGATQRIAGGQLSTRVEPPAADDHDEIAELLRSVNAMADGMERSKVLEQQFLLSVSHDLRTPLTSIRGYAEAISDGAAEPAVAAGVIQSESRRLERLVADLLDLAKLQSRSFSLHPWSSTSGRPRRRPCPASSRMPPNGRSRCRCNKVRRSRSPPTRIASPRWPPTSSRTRSATPASRWSSPSPPTAPSRSTTTGRASLAADLPHVFERLYVARSQPQRRESSSGLGLAIVRELVAAMGGEVGAGVAPGGGARLWFRLPAG